MDIKRFNVTSNDYGNNVQSILFNFEDLVKYVPITIDDIRVENILLLTAI